MLHLGDYDHNPLPTNSYRETELLLIAAVNSELGVKNLVTAGMDLTELLLSLLHKS